MSTGTSSSSSLVDALEKSEKRQNLVNVVGTLCQKPTAKNSDICIQDRNGQARFSVRRPLRGSVTGLLIPHSINQSPVRIPTPVILRSGANHHVAVHSKEPVNFLILNTTTTSVLGRRCLEMKEGEFRNCDNDNKQYVCSNCRALTDATICNVCDTRLNPEAKRLKTESVITPLVTITKLVPDNTSVIINAESPRRYQPLQVTKVNSGIITSVQRVLRKNVTKDPPECLTLSSDDEDGNSICESSLNEAELSELASFTNKNSTQLSKSTTGKESPVAVNISDGTEVLQIKKDVTKYTINCRSIRFGSFKLKNTVLHVTEKHFNVEIPSAFQDKALVPLNISFGDIGQVLAHFGPALPCLFMKTSSSCCSAIRNRLQMDKNSGPYYDCETSDDTIKRIVVLPEEIPDDFKMFLKRVFKQRDLNHKKASIQSTLMEISYVTANEILLKSVPAEIKNQVISVVRKNSSAVQSSPAGQIKPVPEADSRRMVIYPSPPLPGGITITANDYRCLNPETCLNDAIIDFYLKYLYYEKLSESDRKRTHIFSSFFYGKLASSRSIRSRLNSQRSAVSMDDFKNRLKGWTKHVDIFEKDFIIIPINQKNHWFLAIICFPNLVGETQTEQSKKTEEVIAVPLQVESRPSLVSYDDDSSSSDSSTKTVFYNCEATASPADVGSQDIEMQDLDDNNLGNSESSSQLEQSKLPCILLFDSLHTRNWSPVVTNLREYLNMEWKSKRTTQKIFDKDSIKGAYPIVPQQSNYMDCGIYLLQYVESFFENPIKSFQMPVRELQNWFQEDIIDRKRQEIQQLILSLSVEQQTQSKNSAEKCVAQAENNFSTGEIMTDVAKVIDSDPRTRKKSSKSDDDDMPSSSPVV